MVHVATVLIVVPTKGRGSDRDACHCRRRSKAQGKTNYSSSGPTCTERHAFKYGTRCKVQVLAVVLKKYKVRFGASIR